MPFLEWKSSYSVGVPEFDKHHRHLFNLLNRAHDACFLTKQKEVFFDIVTELAEYACYHFAAEEKRMGKSFYPDISAHCKEHAMYISKISELRDMKLQDTEDCTIELIELTQFLMEWLSHHILEVDKRYSQLLASGIRT
jgi:hemerythrin-like metal-binding protein